MSYHCSFVLYTLTVITFSTVVFVVNVDRESVLAILGYSMNNVSFSVAKTSYL